MTVRLFRAGVVAGLMLAGVSAAGCRGEAATTVSGRDLYRSCESCHGSSAEGNVTIDAPRLAGLPAWYVSSQLERFQQGLRGKHPDDAEGLRMRAMASQMLSKAEIDRVAEYIAGLTPPPKAPLALKGDASAGASFYAVCAACHGPKGEGIQQMNAPPIAAFEDWYVARQLRKFQTGVRGRITEDPIGLQMSGMAMTVPPDAVDNVAAYVHELSK
jgi:cytochrome c oxidase subunit 2